MADARDVFIVVRLRESEVRAARMALHEAVPDAADAVFRRRPSTYNYGVHIHAFLMRSMETLRKNMIAARRRDEAIARSQGLTPE
jgi:hypothetical protein